MDDLPSSDQLKTSEHDTCRLFPDARWIRNWSCMGIPFEDCAADYDFRCGSAMATRSTRRTGDNGGDKFVSRNLTREMRQTMSFGTETTASMTVSVYSADFSEIPDDHRDDENSCEFDLDECSLRMDRTVTSTTATNEEQEVIIADSFSWGSCPFMRLAA